MRRDIVAARPFLATPSLALATIVEPVACRPVDVATAGAWQ